MSDTGILKGLDPQAIERVFDTEYLPVTRANINHLAVLVQQGEMTEKELRAELQFQRQQVKDLSATAEHYRALVKEARDERDAANRQLEFFRNQFPTAARNWDRTQGIVDEIEETQVAIELGLIDID